jgi:hypothetical protein
MKARHLIDGASFGPDAMKAITQAYDEAWSVVAGNFAEDAVEAGRARLANALLSVAFQDSRDVHALKRGALEAMALSYAERPLDRASPTCAVLDADRTLPFPKRIDRRPGWNVPVIELLETRHRAFATADAGGGGAYRPSAAHPFSKVTTMFASLYGPVGDAPKRICSSVAASNCLQSQTTSREPTFQPTSVRKAGSSD